MLFKVEDEYGSQFRVEPMVWGIIPTYLDPPSANDHYRMFNKRIESLERGEIAPYFKTVLQTKRCVAIFDGFYEWKIIAGKKHPHYVSLSSGEPMKMAGIYEDSRIFDPKTYSVRPARTFSIITGEPCARFTLHNRQPVFLTDDQVRRWLDCPADEVFTLLSEIGKNHTNPELPFNRTIQFHPVTPKVTNAWYQEPDCSVFKSIGAQLTSFFKASNGDSKGGAGGSAAASESKETGANVKVEACDAASVASAGSQQTEVLPVEDGGGAREESLAGLPRVKQEEGPVNTAGTKRSREQAQVKEEPGPPEDAAQSPPKKATLLSSLHQQSPRSPAGNGRKRGPASPAAAKSRPITSFFAPSPMK